MRDSNSSWQKKLAKGFDSAAELLSYLNLPPFLAEELAEKKFQTRVPRGFAARMQPNDPHDPLLLQVLATTEELHSPPAFIQDPLKEKQVNPVPGLIHKYPGRVLLTLTGVCAINCRFCFRRHFPYSNNNPGRAGWRQTIEYIQADTTIQEVILSGGDPLLASDQLLEELLGALDAIPQVKILRFHTRIPIVLPERITPSFLKLLESTRLKKVMVYHCNHPQELNEEVAVIAQQLKQVGCVLLNQSVLLKNINDDAYILAKLSEKLFDFGILPYYLHLLDKVSGAEHFDIPLATARAIFAKLQTKLPGYLVPRLTREEAGKKSKTLIT